MSSDLTILDYDFTMSGPDETDIRLKSYALVSCLSEMERNERLKHVGIFYERYLSAQTPGNVLRIVAKYLQPFFIELVKHNRETINSDSRYSARVIDELYFIGTPESLELMLTVPDSEALRMYSIRKFPLAEQRRAVELLKKAGIKPIALRALGSEFYHQSVIRWMLEGFVQYVMDNPECMSGPDLDPPTLSSSPLMRNMDTVYQLHRQGFFDVNELNGWWRTILRALRPAVDTLAPVDAFFVNQGDPVGLVDSVVRLVTDAERIQK